MFRRSVGDTSKQPYFHLSACRRSSGAGIQSAIQGEWVFTRRIEDCAKPPAPGVSQAALVVDAARARLRGRHRRARFLDQLHRLLIHAHDRTIRVVGSLIQIQDLFHLYQKPYDPNCPVVCMDEQPVQLVQETRPPMAATKNRPRRVDYEYERAGTAAVFLFSEPLAGWRQATARARRTKVDWALEVAGLLEGRYADCPKITLVCDHLNTHTKGAFYEVFEPARARELVRRIEFCHTPKHGSWLNIAENELSSMTRQCVRGRRIGDLGTLHDEVSAWSTDVNGTQRGVDWQMKVDHARCKLKSVYPHIIT